MKVIKRIFFVICAIVVLLGGGVAVCAFNPEITDSLAGALYGGDEETEKGKDDGTGSAEGGDAETLNAAEDPEPGNTAGNAETGNETGTGNAQTGGLEAGNTAGNGEAGQGNTGSPQGNVISGETGSQTAEGTGTEDENLPEVRNPYPVTEEYKTPSQAGIKAPSNVGGKNGYSPVSERALEIRDKEVKEIQSAADYGETGEELTFDTKFYPYYGMLNGELQHLYRQIYANANALKAAFCPVEKVSVSSLKSAFTAVYNDHPELFWLDSGYTCKYSSSGECVELTLQFNSTAGDLNASKEAFGNRADQILNVAKNLATDYQKEKYVHDTLIQQTEYNLSAASNQSAYSALVNGQSVCAGYSRAFQYLMTELGIPCYYCTGYSGQNHAWNIILLGEEYYNVDTTWDDTEPNTYDYFNRTDADFAGTHMRQDLSVYLSACMGEEYGNLEHQGGNASDKDENLRSLDDLKIKDADVIDNIDAYYKKCYDQLVNAGVGNIKFECAVTEEMWDTIELAYSTRAYEAGYANKVMDKLGANQVTFEIEGEELEDGYYLLKHDIWVYYVDRNQ